MTRKDFELIADAIAGTEHAHRETMGGSAVLQTLVDNLSSKIERDHPRFDRARFEHAAMPMLAAERKQRILEALDLQES